MVLNFSIVEPIPVIRIVYSKNMVKAASGLRNAFREITNNDRFKLLIFMGNINPAPATVTLYLIEHEGSVAIENILDTEDNVRSEVKLFCSDDLPDYSIKSIVEYLYTFISRD